MMKTCTKCNQSKPLCEFTPSPKRPLGVAAWCKQCMATAKREKQKGTYQYSKTYLDYKALSALGLKACTKCKEQKPFDQFYKDAARHDNLDAKCKSCRDAHNKEYLNKNREKIDAYRKEYYADHREENIIRLKNDYIANREEKLAKNNAYYQSHRPERNTYLRSYYKSPNGRIRRAASWHKRRINQSLSDDATLTPDQWTLCIDEVNNTCPMCGEPFREDLKPTLDHIIPVSRLGPLTYWNVQPLCRFCNSKKGNSLVPEHEIRKAQTIANRLFDILRKI